MNSALLALACLGVLLSSPTAALAANWIDAAQDPTLAADGWYEIATPEQLAGVARWVNASTNAGQKYRLVSDIDLAGREWTPIGDMSKEFQGTFDGRGHVVRNMTIDVASLASGSQTTVYAGLFGYVFAPAGTTGILDVGVLDFAITGTGRLGLNLGGIAGRVYCASGASAAVAGCFAFGRIEAGAPGLGTAECGLIVGSASGAVVDSSYARGSIAVRGGLTIQAGGLVGSLASSAGQVAAIRASAAHCDVKGTSAATAADNVSSPVPYVGGLVGVVYGSPGVRIASCYATGDATAEMDNPNSNVDVRAGGLIGGLGYTAAGVSADVSVSDCYAVGDAKALLTNGPSARGNVGGLVGMVDNVAASIVRSYAFGAASAEGFQTAYVGGFAGTRLASTLTAANCYSNDANGSTVGNGDATGISPLNEAAFATAGFTNFDFTTTWCYTDLDGGTKPNLRAFFDPSVESDGRLNAVSPDLVLFQTVEELRLGHYSNATAARLIPFIRDADSAYLDPEVSGISAAPNGGPAYAIELTAGKIGEYGTIERDLVYTIDGVPQPPKRITLHLPPYDPSSTSGQMANHYVRNVPLQPTGDGEAHDLYIQWEAKDGRGTTPGDVLSADSLPDPLPEVAWSVVEPTDGGNWSVSVTPDDSNPFKARLSVAKKGSNPLLPDWEEYGVSVYMKQVVNGEAVYENTYTRTFLVGEPFPTTVVLSPEAQAEIDRVNAILARSDVRILAGNHQKPLTLEMQNRIVDHLMNKLVIPTSSLSSRGAPDAFAISLPPKGYVPPATDTRMAEAPRAASLDLYVLASLDRIEELRVESPDVASVPDCFVCTDKESANIVLDLTKLTEAGDRIVLVPMSYTVKIKSADLIDFYGEGLANEIVDNPINNLDRIFEVLVLHKRIKEGSAATGNMTGWYTRLVNGVTSPKQAQEHGILRVWSDTTERSLTVSLGYYVVDYHGESFTVSGPSDELDASSAEIGYIILPDGVNNKRLIDPLWTNRWKADSGSGSGGGGGGCATGAAALALLAAVAAIRRRK